MTATRWLGRPGVLAGRRDQGSGTVLLVGVVAVVLTLLGATGLLVSAERARAAAQAAADLAALAAAEQLTDPRGTGSVAAACTLAAAVTVRNDAQLVTCTAHGGGVITVTTSRAVVGIGAARATARAGPAAVRGSP